MSQPHVYSSTTGQFTSNVPSEYPSGAANAHGIFDLFDSGFSFGKLLDTLPLIPVTSGPIESVVVMNSADPIALVGPSGYGTQQFIQPTGALPYTIDFENNGSATVQNVQITEQLDSNLDWSTFQLGSFGFGSEKINVPGGQTGYQTTVSYQNSDGSSLNVQVAMNFNVQTGQLTVSFTSLDPDTQEAPTAGLAGFLPTDNGSHVGEGFVQYTVEPKANLSTGTTINQKAAVVFDVDAPISTKTFTNTIDAVAPTSSVQGDPCRGSGHVHGVLGRPGRQRRLRYRHL